jgi:cobalamin biosynthesis protein CobD/CbiB
MNVGVAELVIVVLAVLPGLLGVAIAIWLVVTTLQQRRRIAHLEERVRTLERGGPTRA